MRPFDYSSAATVDETIQLLGQRQDHNQQIKQHIKALAGGTDLLPLMKAGIAAPVHLVDIKRLDEIPHGILEGEEGTTLGALTTLAEIELNENLQRRFPVLSQAAALAATPQLRNMATLGGNLLQRPRCWYFRHAHFHCWLKGGEDCHALEGQNQFHAFFGDSPCVAAHPSDLPAALIALDAEVRLRGPVDERTLTVEEFFTLPQEGHRQETQIAADELILSVHVPPLPQKMSSIYLKAMDRKAWAFALVGVAARLEMEGERVAQARLVLNGVAPIPWRLHEAEQMLSGTQPDEKLITNVAESALAQAHPLEHNSYKVPLAKSLIRRALHALLEMH
jgi:xanthine dehydrogenase YagS FAD-binding subunit